MVYTVSFETFMQFVEMRQDVSASRPTQENQRDKVLRPDQKKLLRSEKGVRRLATCPTCDFVVDSELLNAASGLCPRCHEMQG